MSNKNAPKVDSQLAKAGSATKDEEGDDGHQAHAREGETGLFGSEMGADCGSE